MGAQMQTEEPGKNGQAGQMSAGKPPQVKRRTAVEVIADWAADLTPANAPEISSMGPLAWVRNCKVQELVTALAKEGIK